MVCGWPYTIRIAMDCYLKQLLEICPPYFFFLTKKDKKNWAPSMSNSRRYLDAHVGLTIIPA